MVYFFESYLHFLPLPAIGPRHQLQFIRATRLDKSILFLMKRAEFVSPPRFQFLRTSEFHFGDGIIRYRQIALKKAKAQRRRIKT